MRFLGVGLLTWIFLCSAAQAFELKREKVTNNVYALVGDIGPRTPENHALNNTLGFIVTLKGVMLVGSGANPAGARLIEQAVAEVTDLPIRWVVNIGAQDHHWLGNSYFVAKGAKIIALAETVDEQKRHLDDHLARLKALGPKTAFGVEPVYSSYPILSYRDSLHHGGIDFELIWPGGGHFEGDAILWMPEQKVLFAGDHIFHDRMLGVQPFTPVRKWRKSVEQIGELKPLWIIPGHGYPGDWSRSRRDSGAYLDWLVERVGAAIEDWQGIGETVDELAEAPQFRHLKFYDGWHRRNINRTYLLMEGAQ